MINDKRKYYITVTYNCQLNVTKVINKTKLGTLRKTRENLKPIIVISFSFYIYNSQLTYNTQNLSCQYPFSY